ncbi:MAG: T9SS type A sorting domain-containing protein [Bacteroidetes bacterium]|nr:T9SS type A sorting domain-containing protein [Bacteroidota bacterium]
MRKSAFLLFMPVILAAIILFGFSVRSMAYPSGAPAGYTGSPGDGHHCVSCHNGSAATVSGWITSNIPTQGYTPGVVYTITVTVSGTGKKGFEVSPQDPSGVQLGTLAAGTGNHLVTGGTKYVTQNSAGSTSSTVTWSFTWTAPSTGTGVVTFYGAFTVAKANTKLSTLIVSENTALPLSATASATPSQVCAGQTVQLNVAAVGGSGSYTYQWTSIPPGFTSSIQNPTVIPTVSTQYIAQVSDGAGSVDAPANVTVTQPATAFAGDDTTCAYITTSVPLGGIAANYSSVAWATNGTGTFTAPASLTGEYLPGTADKDGGIVELSLTAFPQSPCSANVVDLRIVHFDAPTGKSEVVGSSMVFSISPNPSDGRFALHVNYSVDEPFNLTISDVSGVKVLAKSWNSTMNLQEELNLTDYPKGIYFVQISNDHFSAVRKVIIK